MAQVRKGSKVQSKISALIFGQPFTGKSTIGLSMAYLKNPDGSPFKLLVLDSEQGGCDDQLEVLERDGVNLDNIVVVYSQSLEEVREYIKKATEQTPWYEDEDETVAMLDSDGNPWIPNAILLDGSSVLKTVTVQALTEMSRKRSKIRANSKGLTGDEKFVAVTNAAMELRDFQNLNNQGMALILDLCASGLHWVVTAREKAETMQREINGKSESINTGKFVFDGFKGSDYNCKTIIRMFRNEDEPDVVYADVQKDRTGVLGVGVIEDPSLLPYQKMIDNTKDRTEFVPKNTMGEAVKAEGDLFARSIGAIDEDEPKTTEKTESLADIISDLMNRKNNLSAMKKQEFKTALENAGLPTAFKSIKDIGVAKAILAELNKIA